MAKGPVLIELEGEVASRNDVNTAPTLPDPAASTAEGQAMQTGAKRYLGRAMGFCCRAPFLARTAGHATV